MIKIYKNFAEHKAFKTNYPTETIFGGKLLAVKSNEFINFYDWDTFNIIQRIDVQNVRQVYWSPNGNQLILALEDEFYLLDYNE